MACSGMWTIPILRSSSQSLSNSRSKRPIQTRAPKASNLDSLHPFSPLRRNRAALSLSNARTAKIVRENRPEYVLESFFYIKPWQVEEMPKWKMFLLDSGAFTFMHGVEASSKPVDWDGYLSRDIDFINRHDVQHFFELDVDIIVGYDAVKRMRARLEAETGKQSIPVWHRSRGLDEFKSLCRDYPYIGIGGFAIKHIQPSEYGYIKRLVQYANACGVRVHGLGYTNKDAVDFGFYSVDSTTWTTQVNFGGLSYFNGSEMVVVRPPKGMIGADYRIRREYALKEWIKYQKYLDTKGKWRG